MKTVLLLASLIAVGGIGWMNSDRVAGAYDSFCHWAKDSGTTSGDSPISNWFAGAKPEALPPPVVLTGVDYFLKERLSFESDGSVHVANAGTKVRKLGESGAKYLIAVGSYRTVAESSKLTQTSADLPQAPTSSTASSPAITGNERGAIQQRLMLLDQKIAQTNDELAREERRQDKWKMHNWNSPMNDRSLYLQNLVLGYQREKSQLQMKLAALPAPASEGT